MTPALRILLPAFNEEEALAAMFPELETLAEQLQPFHVVVVDDGSDDSTTQVTRAWSDRLPLELIEHGNNRGLGAAIRTSFDHILSNDHAEDLLVVLDADNTQPIRHMVEMRQRTLEGFDCVVASRFVPRAQVAGVSAGRKLLSDGASTLSRLLFPSEGLRDYSCGYRAYRIAKLQELKAAGIEPVTETGFAYVFEVIVKLRAKGARFSEIPLDLRNDLKPSASKMRILRNIARTLWLMARYRFKRI